MDGKELFTIKLLLLIQSGFVGKEMGKDEGKKKLRKGTNSWETSSL